MLNFTELSRDGQAFEQLIREILVRRGFDVQWSGRGPDGGRDLVCIERREGYFVADEKRWLIQCKHNANGGASVSVNDLDSVVDSCSQHRCAGYLLACSTQPSSAVVNRLEGITADPRNDLTATYWDAVRIEQILATPRNWPLAQRFFPVSANASGWQIYGTERPNHWVVNYQGYYFHLSNRIGSSHEGHLPSIVARISEIQALGLPNGHFIRVRAVYYDDKNGGYTWYLDYLYPHREAPILGSADIKYQLRDGYALEDGQIYNFDVRLRSYFPGSDHFDPDHYDYYDGDFFGFHHGVARSSDGETRAEAYKSEHRLLAELMARANDDFARLVEAFRSVGFVDVVRATNAQIEALPRFNSRRDWSGVFEETGLNIDHPFAGWILLRTEDPDRFLSLIGALDQSVMKSFRCTRVHVFMPGNDGRGSVESTDDEHLFELTLSVHPMAMTDLITARTLLNEYFDSCAEAVRGFLEATAPSSPPTKPA